MRTLALTALALTLVVGCASPTAPTADPNAPTPVPKTAQERCDEYISDYYLAEGAYLAALDSGSGNADFFAERMAEAVSGTERWCD